MVQVLFRTQRQHCRHPCLRCLEAPWPTKSHVLKFCATFRAVAILVKRDRHTQRQRDRQSCRGPSVSQQQPYRGGSHKGVRAALGFSCLWSVRIILMKDRLFPPIPGLLPSSLHILSNLKRHQTGEKGRAWVTCQGLPSPEGRPKHQ